MVGAKVAKEAKEVSKVDTVEVITDNKVEAPEETMAAETNLEIPVVIIKDHNQVMELDMAHIRHIFILNPQDILDKVVKDNTVVHYHTKVVAKHKEDMEEVKVDMEAKVLHKIITK